LHRNFWIGRFIRALLVAGALLLLVEIAKGHGITDALRFAALWGLISAALFTLAGYIRYRRNPACMLPRDKQP
jgi:hypothetical protein